MEKGKYIMRTLWFMVALLLFVFFAGCATDEEKETSHHKRAKEYIAKGELKKAVIELKNVVQLNPENDTAYYELGETYVKLGQAAEAFQAFSRAASINKDNIEAQLKIGQILLLGKETEKARKKAEFIMEKSPENIDALILLSGVQLQEKKIETALKTLEKGQSIDRRNYKIQLSMGRIFLVKNDLDRAKKAFQEAKSIDPSSSIPYISLSRIYGLENRWDLAESELKELIKESGSSYGNLFELARFYESRKEWEKAEKIYVDAANSMSEDDVTPLIHLGSFYSRRNSFDKALKAMQKAASIREDDPAILVHIARLYLEEKQIKNADDTLNKILEKDKGHVEASFLKGRIHLINKDFDSALPLFDLTVRERPDNPMAHYFKALCLLKKGENRLAREDLVKAVELDPNFLDARLLLAEYYLWEKNNELARQQIDEALRLDPNSIKALMLNGNLNIVDKKLTEAETAFMQVVKKAPNYAPAYTKLGLLYSLKGEQEKALENLEKALNLDPMQMNALALAVNIHTKAGEHDKALQICKSLKTEIGQDTSSLAQILYIEGTVYLAKNDTTAASQRFEEAISTDANIVAAYISLAKLCIKENRIEQAISHYKALVNEEPQSLTGHMGLGTLYDQKGDFQKAEASYRKALEIRHNFAPAANNLAWLLMKNGGNIDEALGFAQIAKEQMPQNSSVMDTLGWIYYLKGSYLNAITELQDSLARDPNNAVINYHMGMAYFKNGQADKAKQYLEKALEIDQNFNEAENALRVLKEIDA